MLNSHDFVVSYLLEEKLLSPEAIAQAQRKSVESNQNLHEALVSTGAISWRDLAIARASVAECCFVDLAHYDIDVANAALLPRTVAEKLNAFAIFRLETVTVVGMADPTDLRAVDRLRAAIKGEIEVVQVEPSSLASLIARAYSIQGAGEASRSSGHREVEAPDPSLAQDPIVAAVNQIIAQGIEHGASDIHLNPDEKDLFLRYRVDGSLQPRQGPPLASHPALVQRLKVMSGLDLTQARRPQDGKFRFVHRGKNIDVRVSTVPTVCGENVVLRLLAGEVQLKDFASLGMSPDAAQRFEACFEQPNGMILVTGPTGSGKTTTLYTGLQRVNTPDRNVVAIEDPVEIRLPMVRHVQVHAEIGLTFAAALRSILRQDPDVILVGEIRDEETARIALQAALTGHLVLSTVHTNDATSTVARLTDFGCPVFAINSALRCVLAQRLVRRVCAHCSQSADPDPLLLQRFGLVPGEGQFRKGGGCPRCASSGYRGRVALTELLSMTPAVQRVIEERGSSNALRRAAIEGGMKPLWLDGVEKAKLGVTTLDELLDVASGATESDIEILDALAASKVASETAVRMSA